MSTTTTASHWAWCSSIFPRSINFISDCGKFFKNKPEYMDYRYFSPGVSNMLQNHSLKSDVNAKQDMVTSSVPCTSYCDASVTKSKRCFVLSSATRGLSARRRFEWKARRLGPDVEKEHEELQSRKVSMGRKLVSPVKRFARLHCYIVDMLVILKHGLRPKCVPRCSQPDTNNNNSADEDGDDYDDVDPDYDAEVDDDDEEDDDEFDISNIKDLESKVFTWHILMLSLSVLLMILGFILLFGFSPYVSYIITTYPGYNNYGHFVNFAYEPKTLRFGELTNVLGTLLIILNGSYIVCQFIYLSFLVHRNPFTLPMIILLSGAVILVEVNMINIYMSPVVAMNDDATDKLKEKLTKSYAIFDTNTFSVTYDIIAIWGHCCGIINQYDFQTMLLKYRSAGQARILQVPATCCKETNFINGITDVVECAVRAEDIYPIGCYSMLFEWLLFYCKLYSLVVIIQLLDMCVHILLYKRRVKVINDTADSFQTPVFETWLSHSMQ